MGKYLFTISIISMRKKQPAFPLEWGQGLRENVVDVNDWRKTPRFLDRTVCTEISRSSQIGCNKQ